MYSNIPIQCAGCSYNPTRGSLSISCDTCHYTKVDTAKDATYKDNVRPMQLMLCGVLPLAYLASLLYVFKTHAMYVMSDKLMRDGVSIEEMERKLAFLEASTKHIITKKIQGGGHSGHGPDWSLRFCCGLLLGMICLFSLVAHVLVATVAPAAKALGFSMSFTGLTLIAVIPNTTSFVNAVRFAMENRIRLSIEIGCSVATQVGLLQIPLLNLFLLFVPQPEGKPEFTTIFGGLTIFFLIFAVLINIYVLFAGKANYFEGCGLIIIYVLIICSFYFAPEETLNASTSPSEVSWSN